MKPTWQEPTPFRRVLVIRGSEEPIDVTNGFRNERGYEVWAGARGIDLTDRRVLVVEDEVLVAATIACECETAGAEVVGPAYSVEEALALAGERIDVAVLDINLLGKKVWPVASMLHEHAIPYVFASANVVGPDAIPAPFDAAPRFDKPVSMGAMLAALAILTEGRQALS